MALNLKKLITHILSNISTLNSNIGNLNNLPAYTPVTTYNPTNAGTIELGNGLLLKYGAVAGAGGTAGDTNAAGNNQRVTFPTPFPNNCFFVITGVGGIGKTTNSYTSYINSTGWDRTGFYGTINGINYAQGSNNTYFSTGYINYIAIGN